MLENTSENILNENEQSSKTIFSLSDEEKIVLAQNGSSEATEYILNKYKKYVKVKARSYYLMGADNDDIVQEGMIGLFKAIRDFRPNKLNSFRSFAELCITRQIITAIKKASRNKHVPLNTYVSLDKPIFDQEGEYTLLDMIVEKSNQSPESIIFDQEKTQIMYQYMEKSLSQFEQEVFRAYVNGKNYQEIAIILNKPAKSIDNALQRLKRKLEKYIIDFHAQEDT